MGSALGGKKKPEAVAAKPVAVAAEAKQANTDDVAMAADDQARRRRGISQMYNRFGAMGGGAVGKDKLGV